MGSVKLEKFQKEFQEKLALADKLLSNIKENLNKIESCYDMFVKNEPDDVYRFYHQSSKVFRMVEQVKYARALFEDVGPKSALLNSWFVQITDEAVGKKFDSETTNSHWLSETRPVLEGFWHTKYFLEQMIQAAKELETAPQILPSSWAAVLYLYNMR
jgi:hypothetical protein